MTTVVTKIRIATAASAVAAAATLMPAAVAYASPAAPLPQVGLGSTLGGDSVAPCDPGVEVCTPVTAALIGDVLVAGCIRSPGDSVFAAMGLTMFSFESSSTTINVPYSGSLTIGRKKIR